MGFGEIFGKSWREYSDNFKVLFKLFLYLSIIPTIVIFIIQVPYALEIFNLGVNPSVAAFNAISMQPKHIVVGALTAIASIVFLLFLYSSLVYNALYRKKEMSVKESLSGGKKYAWKYFLYCLVLGIFLIGLFILLIIPGIIFLIFWTFSAYILIGENKGILESLKESRRIVSGKWWRVFGYSLLFFIIIVGISIVFSIVGAIVGAVVLLFEGTNITGFHLLTSFISLLFDLGGRIITVPLAVLFFKNFYLDMKGSAGKTSKK